MLEPKPTTSAMIGAALAGMLLGLQEEVARALGADEAVAVEVERPAGRSGSSLWVVSAFMAQKVAMPQSERLASVPPASMASASPY